MIVVKFIGGLGNQMFQYALYRNLLEQGKDVYYDSLQNKEHNGFELEKVFNIVAQPIKSLDQINNLSVVGDKTWPKFDPNILLVKDSVYLEGNWQSNLYFPEEKILKKDFSFKRELNKKNKDILKDIEDSDSVAIHVRRTDYTKMPNYFFQANWLNYYAYAVTIIHKNRKIKEQPLKFFVFSDDIDWCKNNFMIPAVYVENYKIDAWQDMLLMSRCKHNIIANSTFSWWAAWLNDHINKIVITPKRWVFESRFTEDCINLPEWIKI